VCKQDAWRYDQTDQEIQTQPSKDSHRETSIEVTRYSMIAFSRNAETREFLLDADGVARFIGKIGTARKKYPALSAPERLPVTFLLRPELTEIYAQLCNGMYQEQPSEKATRVHCVCVALHAAAGSSELWFDQDHEFVLVRMAGRRSALEVEYADVPALGYVPAGWRWELGGDAGVTHVDTNGQVRWHKRAQEIDDLLAIEFPPGMKVRNADTRQVFTTGPNGELVPHFTVGPDGELVPRTEIDK
jgi:hypothetical protein